MDDNPAVAGCLGLAGVVLLLFVFGIVFIGIFSVSPIFAILMFGGGIALAAFFAKFQQ